MNKQKIIYILLALSLLANAFLLGAIIFNKHNNVEETPEKVSSDLSKDKLQEKAKDKVKQYVCSNLYIPESYDPVETRVDSAFYSVLTDYDCVDAAIKLISLRRDYSNTKRQHEEAINNIRTFGGTGVFRHFSVERDDTKKSLDEIKPQIIQHEQTIRNRDKSHDGEFIGWFVYNRYRAKSNNNVVSFGEVLLLFDKQMDNWQLRYNVEKNQENNIEDIQKVIEDVLSSTDSFIDRN